MHPSLPRLCVFFLLGLVAACGGSDSGDAGPPDFPAPFDTLAYVVTECRDDGDAVTIDQHLRIERPDADPWIVAAQRIGPLDPETPVVFPFSTIPPQPVGIADACQLLGQLRLGTHSVFFFYFQDVSVSPDGTGVVFEVTDNFSPLPGGRLPAEDEGVFFVRSDGSDLRRIGDARTVASFALDAAVTTEGFAFSPDGRSVVYVDGAAENLGGEERPVEIVTVDLDDGTRRAIARLPPAPPATRFPPTCCANFIDDDTVAFSSTADVGGLNPLGEYLLFTVDTDGSNLTVAGLRLPADTVSPAFAITGTQPAVTVLEVDSATGAPAPEIFFFDETGNLLQLTRFQRQDTISALLGIDGATVIFPASADPEGRNPDGRCQLFSIATIGGAARQLTEFGDAGPPPPFGCLFSPFPGCAIGGMFQDPRHGSLIFYSSCDPLGTNPRGAAIFAMRPDGSGLRQLTQTRGATTEDGVEVVELPGPYGYRSARPAR